jgi:hypothetical protein
MLGSAAKLVHNTSMSKEEMRKRLAALSFSEKIKILEKLRDRSKVIAACGLRRVSNKSCQTQAMKGQHRDG